MTENTSSSFLNLVDWYVNDIFFLSHDILILEIFIMFLVFLNSVFYIDYQCIFFNWEFFHVFCDYDFLVLTVIFWLILHIMISLITFLHFVMYIFRIFVNSVDFISSFYDVFCTCCYDMLFSMIIHMSLYFCFS